MPERTRVGFVNGGAGGVAGLRLAWRRGAGWERVRRRVRATSAHPRLGEVVLVAVTFALVGVLLATVQHALEASPAPAVWAFGVSP